MGKLKRNKEIIAQVNQRLKDFQIDDQLLFEPIENTFKSRPKYGVYKDGTRRFSAFLWQLNTLDRSVLAVEIDSIINKARKHFKI
ncbi:hypothetical protein [Paenibacillus sp. DCT19]|uniref:hypothetical protein n=1 Tax=Paenibacillus sp. DCT19 TaxID=2211212 RepID=UPI000FE21427|nr:hypothetical protein [Paenibacillus sp. DCT19]